MWISILIKVPNSSGQMTAVWGDVNTDLIERVVARLDGYVDLVFTSGNIVETMTTRYTWETAITTIRKE